MLLFRILASLISWAIFIYVVLYIHYPDSLLSATIFQVLVFFIPLFLAITFSIDFLFKNLFASVSLSLGVVILLILKALGALSIVSILLTLVAILLLINYFKSDNFNNLKMKKSRRRFGTSLKDLTSNQKIPKLTHKL